MKTVNKQKRARLNLEEGPTAQNTQRKQEAFLWELREELTQYIHAYIYNLFDKAGKRL